MTAIIIDDEPKAIELLEKYLVHFPEIELCGAFRNGLKALSFIHASPPDLIFLDINMPHMSGMSIARLLDRKISIIFTTAYAEHAVESYELSAVDYLLKPVTLERFTRAVQRVLQVPPDRPAAARQEEKQYLLIKSGSRIYRLDPDELLYLEKDHNYMTYYTGSERIIARQSAAEALSNLPDHFVQIHKSYIVNLQRIDFFDKHEVSVQGRRLSLGASFRAAFVQRMMEWQ